METTPEQNMEKAILEAAEKLFLEKGFDATSTTQIAREVGCNQALVHYYFRTKDNLFNTIFESKFRTFFQEIFDTTKLTTLSFTDKIKHIAETHFDLIAVNPLLPRLILNELSRKPENVGMLRDKLHTLPEQMFEGLNKEMQDEISAGRIKNITILDLIATILSLNVAIFIILPIATEALQIGEDQKRFMLAHRRSENINIIMSYLRP